MRDMHVASAVSPDAIWRCLIHKLDSFHLWYSDLFAATAMATPRLRHRPQTEDEDAAALKLGAGEFSIFILGGTA